MPFFKSLPDDAGPANVFGTYTDIYGPWSKMGQAIMNGPSPFSPGERELIAAFVVGTANCRFAYTAHSAAAYAWGIDEGLIEKLVEDPLAEEMLRGELADNSLIEISHEEKEDALTFKAIPVSETLEEEEKTASAGSGTEDDSE